MAVTLFQAAHRLALQFDEDIPEQCFTTDQNKVIQLIKQISALEASYLQSIWAKPYTLDFNIEIYLIESQDAPKSPQEFLPLHRYGRDATESPRSKIYDALDSTGLHQVSRKSSRRRRTRSCLLGYQKHTRERIRLLIREFSPPSPTRLLPIGSFQSLILIRAKADQGEVPPIRVMSMGLKQPLLHFPKPLRLQEKKSQYGAYRLCRTG